MTLWHRHKWEVESVHFTPPISDFHLRAQGYEVIRPLMEGRTNIYQRCVECGLIRSESVYGKYEPADSANAGTPRKQGDEEGSAT